MNKKDIIEFFDRLAPTWDNGGKSSDEIINRILDLSEIKSGVNLLDVACGTGVLFPYYVSRGAEVVGIDISPEMVKAAKQKFPDIEVINADVTEYDFGRKFDRVVVYNAFPHFPHPEALIEKLAALTNTGGRLTVAHGMSKKELDAHHKNAANSISLPLMEETELKELFSPYFVPDVAISDDRMYIVSGVKL